MSRIGYALAGCAALLVASVAGCGGGDSEGQAVASSSTSASESAVSTTMPATQSTPPPVKSTSPPVKPTPPPAVSSECKAADLTVSLGDTEGAAGTMYYALVFTNAGGRTCTIQGFPGVSFVAGDDGHQVGPAAVWTGEKGPVITLKPGATATAPLGIGNIGAVEPAECQPTPVRGLRVYPPHDSASEFVPFETTACARTSPNFLYLRVLTVHEGSGLE